ncbi:MAG: GNAT family N-acetyltransferase [Pirellulales bacterium]|nr:GNAT family N-acetyltransferase [Pirellulales bacterium]
MPTARAELVAHWLEQFAPRARLQCLAVEHQGQLVAALPLIEQRLGRVFRVGGLPRNDWSPGGELLLDPATDVQQALEILVRGMRELAWPMLWLNEVELDAAHSQALLAAFDRAGMTVDVYPRFDVGWVETTGCWTDYEMSRSKNFRRRMNRLCKSSKRDGLTGPAIHDHASPEELDRLLRRAFEVEDRSWKGRNRSSVLQTPGMYDFYFRQAKILAELGHLQLSFLESPQGAAAFEYGLIAKNVYHSFKVGYDDQFAKHSPGRLLLSLILERLFQSTQWQAVDFMGPLEPSMSSFVTSSRTFGRIVVAPRSMVGRTLLRCYKTCWPTIRKLRESIRPDRILSGTARRHRANA